MASKDPPSRWPVGRTKLVMLAFLGIAGFFLVTEHTAHVFGVLPYLLLLACPLLHFFGHGGHGTHSAATGAEQHPNGQH